MELKQLKDAISEEDEKKGKGLKKEILFHDPRSNSYYAVSAVKSSDGCIILVGD